jgi:tetratricopeptide (TPR) repeat protein
MRLSTILLSVLISLQSSDLERARELLRAKDFSRAAEVLRALIAAGDDSAAAHSLLGVATDNLRMDDEAERHLLAAAAKEPSHSAHWNNLALHFLRRGNRGRAIEHLRKAVELNPSGAASGLNLASLLREDRQYAEAQPVLERALQASPSDVALRFLAAQNALDLGRPARVLELYPASMRAKIPPPAWNLIGEACLALGQPEEADAAFAQNPGDAGALRERGWIASQGRRFDGAVALLRQSLSVEERPGTWLDLGWTYVRMEDFERAQQALERAVSLAPSDAVAQASLARIFIQRNDPDRALAAASRAIQLDPALPFGYHYRGQAHDARGELEAAQTDFEKAVSLRPDFTVAHIQLGKVRLARGQYAEAERALRSAVSLNPNAAQPHYLLATLYRRTGRNGEAEEEAAAFERLRAKEAAADREDALADFPHKPRSGRP